MLFSFLSLLPLLIAVFLFSLWRPKIAIFLPIIFHASFLIKTKFFFIPSTGLEVIIISVLVGVWAGAFLPISKEKTWLFISGLKDLSRKHLVFVLLVSAFILSSTVSAAIAPHTTTAWGAWKAFIVEPILYALTLAYAVKRLNLWGRLIGALLAGGAVSCLFSLVFWRLGDNFWRFRGIYDVPNSLALVLAPLLVISILVLSTAIVLTRTQRLVLCVLVCVFGLLLIATQSIAGVASVVLTLSIVFIVKRKFSRQMLIGIFLIVLLAIVTQVSSGKITHLLNRSSSSLIAREQIWTVSASLVKDNALFGTGLGTFEPAYQEKMKMFAAKFSSPGPGILEWVVRDPHNIFLSFWLNTGILGLLSIAALVFTGIRKSVFSPQPNNSNNRQYIFVGAALLSLIIFGLFDVPYLKNDLALLWWVYLVSAIL